MATRLYTEACVRDMRPGSRLVLTEGALATPAALDLAYLRGIEVCYGEGSAGAPPGSVPSALQALLEQDGTYVVEVRAGVPSVHRLTPAGPQPVD